MADSFKMTRSGLDSVTGMQSRHLSTHIDRPASDVYDYAADPANLPSWAAGLGTSIEREADHWIVDSPGGRIVLTYAPKNEFGVIDHEVTLPTGEVFYNPVRVTPDRDGCEVVFSLRRQPGMSDEDFERDARAVQTDLEKLKEITESR